jgi:hypothetical protein
MGCEAGGWAVCRVWTWAAAGCCGMWAWASMLFLVRGLRFVIETWVGWCWLCLSRRYESL